jgi:hypothetical protein
MIHLWQLDMAVVTSSHTKNKSGLAALNLEMKIKSISIIQYQHNIKNLNKKQIAMTYH